MSWRLRGGGDKFDVNCIEEAICRQVVGQVINVGAKKYRSYDKTLGDTTYGLSRDKVPLTSLERFAG